MYNLAHVFHDYNSAMFNFCRFRALVYRTLDEASSVNNRVDRQ